MSDKRYTEEFKVEAIKQNTERGHSVYDVSRRMGVTTHSLYSWRRKYGNTKEPITPVVDQTEEIRRLKAELKRERKNETS